VTAARTGDIGQKPVGWATEQHTQIGAATLFDVDGNRTAGLTVMDCPVLQLMLVLKVSRQTETC